MLMLLCLFCTTVPHTSLISSTHTYTHTHAYTHTHTPTHTHTHTYIHTHTHTHTYTQTHIHAHTHTHTHTNTQTHTHTHTHTHTYLIFIKLFETNRIRPVTLPTLSMKNTTNHLYTFTSPLRSHNTRTHSTISNKTLMSPDYN